MIEASVAPFNLKNVFFQDGFIKNMKSKAQIRGHQNVIPFKKKWA
jgi:hypothetical protein